jgi:hypothetical protein
MERLEEMCKDGLLGPWNYGLFEDWLAIDRSRDGYICIRDGLVLEGEVQEMDDEENFYEGPYKARVRGFFLAYHQCLRIVGGSHSVRWTWSVTASSR